MIPGELLDKQWLLTEGLHALIRVVMAAADYVDASYGDSSPERRSLVAAMDAFSNLVEDEKRRRILAKMRSGE